MRAPADLLEKRKRANDTLDRIDDLLDRIDDLSRALAQDHDGEHGERRNR